jgi:hypothetical protein
MDEQQQPQGDRLLIAFAKLLPDAFKWLLDKGVPTVLLFVLVGMIFYGVFWWSPHLLVSVQKGYDRNAVVLEKSSLNISKAVADALVESQKNREMLTQLHITLSRDMETRTRRLDLMEKQIDELLRILRRRPLPDDCYHFPIGPPILVWG